MLGLPHEGSELYQSELPFFMKYVGWQYVIYDFFLARHAELNCWGFSHSVEPDSEIGKYLFADTITERLHAQVRPIKKSLDSIDDYCNSHIRASMKHNSVRGVVNLMLYLAVPVLVLLMYALCCWWNYWSEWTSGTVFQSVSGR